MKIYLNMDIEGISGIPGPSYHLHTSHFFADGRRYYTEEANVCIDACFEAGAENVVVRDGHGPGDYIIWDQLDPRVELIQGQSPESGQAGIEGCDAQICLGFHAMAGAGGVLDHTFSSATVQNMWVNGELIGEFGVHALMAAEKGIKTIMASGDDKLCAEAKSFLPEVEACEVKKALCPFGARLLPKPTAHARIRESTIRAIRNADQIPLPAIGEPLTLRLEYIERAPTRIRTGIGITRISDRITEMTCETLEQAHLLLR